MLQKRVCKPNFPPSGLASFLELRNLPLRSLESCPESLIAPPQLCHCRVVGDIACLCQRRVNQLLVGRCHLEGDRVRGEKLAFD